MENLGLSTQFENAFRGKKVFVTGHTGFKGSWLCIWLQALGAELKGYALEPEDPSLFRLVERKLDFESVINDIRHREILEKEILGFQPDFVFHLAAQPLVFESYKLPVETFDTNVTGTVHVLNAVRQLRNKCSVLIVTTDKVYENKEDDTPFKEGDPLGGYDPYSASKAAAEIAVQSYRFSFFNPARIGEHQKGLASARAGNVIGGGDFAKNRIIPDYVRSIESNSVLKIRNPKSTRPWQFVLEPLAGYLKLAMMLDEQPAGISSSYNFGPEENDVLTVEQLMKECVKVMQKGSYEFEKVSPDFHEAALLRLDISKAKSELNWKPRYDSKTAVKLTMEWYKRVLFEKQDAFEFCEKSILSYAN
jgi:CDP-glucose 4,6-dehydratase